MRVKGYQRKTKGGKVAQVRQFERRGRSAQEEVPGDKPQAEGTPVSGEVARYTEKAAGFVMSDLIRAGVKKTAEGWTGFDKVDYRGIARKLKARVKGLPETDPRVQAVKRLLRDLKTLNDRYGDGKGLHEPEPEQPGEEVQSPGQEGGQKKEPVSEGRATKAVDSGEELDTEPDTEGDEAGDEEEPDKASEVEPDEYVKEFQDHVVSVQRRKYETFVSHKAEKFGDSLIAGGLSDYIIAGSDLVKALFSESPTVAYLVRAEHDRHGENILKRVLSRIGAVPYMVEPIAMIVKDAKGQLSEEIKTEKGVVSVGRRYMYCLGFKPESKNQARMVMRTLIQAAKRSTGREVDGQSSKKPFIISNVLEKIPDAVPLKLFAKKFGNQMVLSVGKGSEEKWDREDKALVYSKGPVAA